MYGNIDLSKLDFSINKCLHKVEFHCRNNILTGITKDLNKSTIQYLSIKSQKLTKHEKEEIILLETSW